LNHAVEQQHRKADAEMDQADYNTRYVADDRKRPVNQAQPNQGLIDPSRARENDHQAKYFDDDRDEG
jgi:hypothetical protein